MAPFPAVNAETVNAETVSAKSVTVAIVDWGVQKDHWDLKDTVVRGARVIPPGNEPPENGYFSNDSRRGHGTMLAGIIAGVAPGVKLLAVKFIDPPDAGDGR